MIATPAPVLDFTFSLVRFAADTTPRDYTFRQLMDSIRDGRWERAVAEVRQHYLAGAEKAKTAGLSETEIVEAAKDAAKPFKLKLPGALLSGVFTERNDAGLKERTPAICADLDGLPNPEGVRDQIIADRHVLAAFISPTGTGLKVVFRIDPAKPHAECYRAAEHYVRAHFGLEIDTSCRNLSRLCFISHDPDAFLADDATPLPDAPPLVEISEPPQHHEHARVDFPAGFISPGDDYDARGDWKSLLRAHGWTEVGEHFWNRPGKTSGQSASWGTIPGHPDRFYVFSSNAPGFAVGPLYKPWHIYAVLEAHGDYLMASGQLYELGYGSRKKSNRPDAAQQRAIDEAAELAVLAGDEVPPEPEVEHGPNGAAPAAGAALKPGERFLHDVPRGTTAATSKPKLRPYTLWKPSQFLAHTIDPGACLLGSGYLELGQWTSFIGIGGIGKTRLALHLAMCQIVGKSWCGLPTGGVPQKFAIFSTENGIRRWKGDLEMMLPNYSDEQRAVLEEHLAIMAMTPEEDGDLNLGNPETVGRLKATLSESKPGGVIFDPFSDMVDGDENKTVDLLATLRTLRHITQTSCPTAADLIIHHARTGAANVAQAGDNFNAGNFARGAKALYSKVRCEIQIAPADRDDPNRFVISCGKANDCVKFTTRCVVFDPEKFTYSVDPAFDIDAWRDDVSGKRKQSSLSIAEVVECVHEKCPLQGDETDTKTVISHFEGSGAAERTIKLYIKNAIDSGYLRRGNKRWLIRMGAKPIPKQ